MEEEGIKGGEVAEKTNGVGIEGIGLGGEDGGTGICAPCPGLLLVLEGPASGCTGMLLLTVGRIG